jgi:hypothetical protein
MNKNKILVLVLGTLLLFNACEKVPLSTTENIFPTDKSLVKFFLLSPNTGNVMIKINDVKQNNLTSGAAGVFPVIVNGSADYLPILPNSSVKLATPFAGTGTDSLIIFNTNIVTEVNKRYSATLADTGVDRNMFIVNDNPGELPRDSSYGIRLVHAMAKSPNLSLIRVDSTSATQVVRDTIIKNIAYKSASDYVIMPLTAKVNAASTTTPKALHSFLRYRLIITNTGASIAGSGITPPQTKTSPGINQRYVTVFASGFATGISTLSPVLQPTLIYN